MNEKFSLSDIARLLAEQVSIEPAKSENFINVLIELINDGIRRDGIIRIKGFGTFKIVLVKERESIHENTGERIIIPAHHKLSFIPDDELKYLINQHFSAFKTEVISNPSEASSLSENSIEDEVSDDNDEIQENTAPPSIIPIDKELKNIPPSIPVRTENKPVIKSVITPRHRKKISSLMHLYIMLGILILICIGCIWYYFVYRPYNSYSSYAENYNTKTSNEFTLPADTTDVKQEESPELSEDSVAIKNNADILSKVNPDQQSTNSSSGNTTNAVAEERQTTSKPAASASSNKVLAKVKMESGSRLTLLAQKYYGNKIFWVYIYDYNKDRIGSNPDNVKAGIELSIPSKEVYGIDNNNANSREKARKLQSQLISGSK
jgi:nucleoid DNA-binding protein